MVFTHGRGSRTYDRDGRAYLDFFAGAGALNHGHNHPVLKRALLDYLEQDGVTHSLDMLTAAKEDFLTEFAARVLAPRGLDCRVQFPGPTGTNSVEAALKLARKVTGRQNVVAFTGGFHGMSLGSLAVTGNAAKRAGAGVPLGHTWRIPYDGFAGGRVSGLQLLDGMLADSSSGMDLPAAVVVETVQGEGGVNPARLTWLADLAELQHSGEADHGTGPPVRGVAGRTRPAAHRSCGGRAGARPGVGGVLPGAGHGQEGRCRGLRPRTARGDGGFPRRGDEGHAALDHHG